MFVKIKSIITLSVILALSMNFVSCGSESADDKGQAEESEKAKEEVELDPLKNKGIGPIDHVELDDELNEEMIAKGEDIFQSKCEACHHEETRYVGPPIGGVTHRRTPEWIMNMILNPSEMLRQDPIGKELFATYMVEMTFQNVSEDEARAILEYFRKVDKEGDYEGKEVL